MRIRKPLGVLVTALTIVTLSTLPASASEKTGFRGCPSQNIVALATVTSGSTAVQVDGWHGTKSFSGATAYNWYSNEQAGNWTVTAPSVFNATASCKNLA